MMIIIFFYFTTTDHILWISQNLTNFNMGVKYYKNFLYDFFIHFWKMKKR